MSARTPLEHLDELLRQAGHLLECRLRITGHCTCGLLAHYQAVRAALEQTDERAPVALEG